VIAFCKDKQRRELILQTPGINGLDYLEVLGMPGCGDQLALTFIKDARGLTLTPANISLTGGTVLQVTGVAPASSEDPLTITVYLNGTGDFSPYTLTLVKSATNADPPAGIDPQLNMATFSFKAGCPAIVDCQQQQCCPANLATPPDIHYLARDYDTIRQAMLDRIATLVPSWTETHEADPGITLVEALAYAADRISYLQDAVNTEAYIGTARSRISLRRHARLVDYQVGEGANARAWIYLSFAPSNSAAPNITVPAGTQFYPLVPGLPAAIDPTDPDQIYVVAQLAASLGPVFDSMEDITLYPEQNEMDFYTWGDNECCLPLGATQATLTGTPPAGAGTPPTGAFSSLKAGQVLIFEEVLGPLSGDPADADPSHRWAVRLTYASTTDNSGNPLVDLTNPSAFLTNIAWSNEDALPFPLCISSVTSEGVPIAGVSVARGNVVAADHGVWTTNESLGTVPPAPPAPVANLGCNCSPVPGALVPRPYFEPVLANQPLTFAAAYAAQITQIQITETTTVPASSPYTYSTTNHATFVADQGVVYASSSLPLEAVASGPSQGQYSVSGGIYTFSSADAGAAVTISYIYTGAVMPSASSFLSPDVSTAAPQITVYGDDGQTWLPTEDLLSKGSEDACFIPEIEWDGTAHLRFGDGTYGEEPTTGVAFTATYRTGNGSAGNVGRDALAHILMAGSAGITAVRNPLAAAGDVDPETMQHIVQVAPFAFQNQMRCVTAADYGAMAARLSAVSQAQGTIRWTGSWYSAFVSVAPTGLWSTALASQVKTGLDLLRMMGTDLVVEEAIFVGLNIGLQICVMPSFFRADVYQAIWQLLVTGDSCTGTPGMLNAVNFQFGQTVYASPIIAAAQSVTGVAAVTLLTFARVTQPMPPGAAPPAQLLMGSVEIPCCNNDPNHADRGFLTLTMLGGK
jgi:predicted phage baseplate assembly protein